MSSRSEVMLRLLFLIAVVSTIGSLIFSELMSFPPCELCWYQRICMYPLILIYGLGLLKTGRDCFQYAFGLVVIGLLLAGYHNLLYFEVIPKALAPCSEALSCSTKQIEWFGFVTIPMLGLFSFLSLFIIHCLEHFKKGFVYAGK